MTSYHIFLRLHQPDLIKDGETGFIMESNSPEYLAKNVISVLNHLNLEKIVKNARDLLERNIITRLRSMDI